MERFGFEWVSDFSEWVQPDSEGLLHVYRLLPPAPPNEAFVPPKNTRPLAQFERHLRLWKTQPLAGETSGARAPILQYRLAWECLQPAASETWRLEFRLSQLNAANPLVQETAVVLRASRPLHSPGGAAAGALRFFEENYRLLLPAVLSPGDYRLDVLLWDAQAKEWVPVDKTNNAPLYGVGIAEFRAESKRP